MSSLLSAPGLKKVKMPSDFSSEMCDRWKFSIAMLPQMARNKNKLTNEG